MKAKQKRETWYVHPTDKVIYPDDLRANPNKYGGLSITMVAAAENGIITIPLIDAPPPATAGTCVSIQVKTQKAAERILKEGKIDILSDKWWSRIESVNPVFHGTCTRIPTW